MQGRELAEAIHNLNAEKFIDAIALWKQASAMDDRCKQCPYTSYSEDLCCAHCLEGGLSTLALRHAATPVSVNQFESGLKALRGWIATQEGR